jgi:predicted metal-dependent phosphotriesterase family hydrolase
MRVETVGPELMTEMFVNDIRHGIGGTEVRSAFRGTTPTSPITCCPRCANAASTRLRITAMLVRNPARYFTGGQE